VATERCRDLKSAGKTTIARSMFMKPRLSKGLGVTFLVCCVMLFALIIQGCKSESTFQKLSFQTEYQAVFLDNGQAFFGKGELGQDYVTLRDVFYIQSSVNPETKEIKNTLIKKGKEWHGPDMMHINRSHVVLIEPVSPDSQVARLIREVKGQTPMENK